MELLNKVFLTVFLCAGIAGCGVKGSPLPPLNPAPLGRGEPTYSDAQKSSKDKKRPNRNQELEERNSSEVQEGL
ncbi:hypothetical protein [Bdellovibrio sp. NC01]|uniref:hypothetical protein n=1 Tax=Bdellovibrio sp. NC01 TaxID=2220073 RepID=UPI00115848E4|nr:hypothetical protein [Bdellovibrio sp. NC01]QDK36138.1 hypothetical protein DOE51_00230 [Bdellovibrio sp. NC01]